MIVSSKHVIGKYRLDVIAPPSLVGKLDEFPDSLYWGIQLRRHNEFVEAVVNVLVHLFAVSI